MAQSDARFGYTAKLSRSDHDLGRPFGFTCAPGMLLPVYSDVVSPGDSLYIKHDLPFMRTTPLAAPSMVDVKVHFESFFVPFQLIYQPADSVLTSINEQFSSSFTLSDIRTNFPTFSYSQYIDTLKNSHPHEDIRAQAFRLADMFGLHPELFLNWTSQARRPWLDFNDGVPTGFFPWQILSYNAIFQYFYRLDDKSQFDSNTFNWDKYYNVSQPINPDFTFMTVHQRPWNFDYFSSMYYSPIVSNFNVFSILPDGAYNDLSSQQTKPITGLGNTAYLNNDIKAYTSRLINNTTTDIQSAISASAIRQIFANEKLAMITGRAKKNYDSQILAHYGVKVPHDVKHEISLIGHDEYILRVGEVTSLASTDDAPLGELAGKGWASSRENGKDVRTHKFVAPVHGVVMTIFSVEPLKRYYGGYEKQNLIYDAYDLPTPEFDRLGNQPMFRFEIGQGATTSDSGSDIVGWKERYYAFKRRSPRVTFAFEQTLRGQGSNNYSAYMLGARPFSENAHFLAPTGTNLNIFSNPSDTSRFYIPFNAMDNIMLASFGYGFCNGPQEGTAYTEEDWNSNPHLLYARDPFIVDCYPHVKKVSWMSKDGEPIYPY